MKIFHINSYYSTSLFYKNLFEKQVSNDLYIDVFVSTHLNLEKNINKYGEYTIISRNYTKWDRFIFHLKENKMYRDVITKYDVNSFSICHAHSLFSNGYIAWKLKKEYGIPYIVAVRNTDVNTFLKKMIHLRKLGIEILRESSQIIFLSKSYKNMVMNKYIPSKYKKSFEDKISVIPNGVDDFWLENLNNKKKELKKVNEIKLLYVGVIDKNKNITTTVKAIELLKIKGINVKFTIVGKVLDNSVFDKIKKFDFVNYVEPKPKEQLLEIYRQHDIFVMPSKTETFGLVYVEAMSQGLPVIYSRGQGFDGQFEEGEVGYSVVFNSQKEISEKICDIIHSYNIISERCLDKIYDFSWEKIYKEYNKLYSL